MSADHQWTLQTNKPYFSYNSLVETSYMALFNHKEARKWTFTLCQVWRQFLMSCTELTSNADESHSSVRYCSHFHNSVWASENVATFFHDLSQYLRTTSVCICVCVRACVCVHEIVCEEKQREYSSIWEVRTSPENSISSGRLKWKPFMSCQENFILKLVESRSGQKKGQTDYAHVLVLEGILRWQ